MILNFLKIALRQLKKYKTYSLINIIGLALGLAISIVLGFYVIDDFTYDHSHEHKDQIYRVLTSDNSGGKGSALYSITSGPLVTTSKEQIPDVIESTLFNIGYRDISLPGQDPDTDGVGARILVTNPGFFNIFSFKILQGDAADLTRRDAVFLTPKMAKTLFGDEDPIGKPIETNYLDEGFVVGLVEEPPSNSHIQYDIVVPLMIDRNPYWYDSWDNVMLSGYLRIREGSDPVEIEKRMISIAEENGMDGVFSPRIQPLLDVHLGSSEHLYDFRNQGKNDISVVYALLVVGIVVLIIAILNFINLSSARASKRSKEVGLRKVAGSERWQLILQFIGESVFLTLIAMIFAISIIQLSESKLEVFLEKQLDFSLLTNPKLLFIFIGIALFTGGVAGLYPSLILSSFRPIHVLKGELTKGRAGARLRSILVVFQFTITIALIVVIFSVINQIKYLKSVDIGYSRDQALLVFGGIEEGEDILKQEVLKLPFVKAAGRIDRLPGSVFTRPELIFEGVSREESYMGITLNIDETFIPTIEATIIEGRNFSKSFPSDMEDGIIINETAVRAAGWDNPIGKHIEVVIDDNPRYKVVGVIKDMHYSRMRQKVEPMVFYYNPRNARSLIIKLEGNDLPKMLEEIAAIYTSLFPDREFHNTLMTDVFDHQFDQDKEFATHLSFFTAIAVIVACLGLFGLTSFIVEHRLKEIAIRKVMGSTERIIVSLLLKDILKWIVLAALIAWPLGYLSTGKWLDNFVYQVPFKIWPFVVSALIAILIALVTISIQSMRAARSNPVNILRQD